MSITFRPAQPETQPVRTRPAIGCSDGQGVQREIPLLVALSSAKWVPEEQVAQWQSYREAVAWCWDNQRLFVGLRDKARQAMFANEAGMHAPHVSRCLKSDGKAPMDLPDRVINDFESFTGWRGVRQWQLRQAGLTCMEQVIDQRRAA